MAERRTFVASSSNPARVRNETFIKMPRGLPQSFRQIRMTDSGEERGLVRPRRPPDRRLATPPHEVGDAHPDDGAPSLRVEAEALAHPLEGRPVRMFDLREGGKAHGVTSRH